MIDCQGFAGGFTLGAVQAGFELIGKREKTGGFGMAQCEANRRLLGDNWEGQACEPDDWDARLAHMVISNPPCSGFSVLSHKSFRGVESKINECMWDAMRFAARCRPEIYIMESVQVAFKKGIELMRQLRDELQARTADTYLMYHVLQDNYSLGGVSKRARYFLVLSRIPFGVEPPPLTALPVLGTAIEDLLLLPEGEWAPQPYVSPPNWWTRQLRSPTGYVDGHVAPVNVGLQRILDLMGRGVPWNEGEHMALVAERQQQLHGDLPESWETNRRMTGETRADWARGRNFDLGMFQVKRWHWDRPAKVVTGAGPTCTIHPKLPRFLTHREVARIMGFPDDWQIESLQRNRDLGAGWGKGVSVHAGRWIADWARMAFNGRPGQLETRKVSDYLPVEDVRNEWVLDVSKHWKTVPIVDHGPVPMSLEQEEEGIAA